MARTPEEIFTHHIHALVARDMDELLVDYGDDSVLITAKGVVRGKDGIRAAFGRLFEAAGDTVFDTTTEIFDGDVLFLEWVLDDPAARTEGADTFVFADDVIRVQTITRSVRPKG